MTIHDNNNDSNKDKKTSDELLNDLLNHFTPEQLIRIQVTYQKLKRVAIQRLNAIAETNPGTKNKH
ncbi:hypothetical protein [Nitrosomonas sp.]|uniref:hypothetical protein n=1 Tax=Nitrosomonas sp. TaxID=42353 RepID=UPI0025E5DA3F|nr:hypothetical protein [Nitrosomonas sp.]